MHTHAYVSAVHSELSVLLRRSSSQTCCACHVVYVHVKVSRKIAKLYSEMIFFQGYIHCDPHPGNVLIRKGSRGQVEVVLLDHGLYTVSYSLTDLELKGSN